MTEKRFVAIGVEWTDGFIQDHISDRDLFNIGAVCNLLNELSEENEQLKKELKRCKDWINSDKNDYELTLSFIKNKGYSLKDVLEYEKELKSE